MFHSQKLFISAKRCTMDMTQCEDFNKLTIPGVCERLNDKDMIWSDLTAMFKPKIKCPIQMVSRFMKYFKNVLDSFLDFN